MKYFNPSYWFKMWVLSAPLFNSKSEGIYAKSIDNQNIKDWASKNTSSLESINESNSFINLSNYQPYSLNETNQNIDPFYQTELETNTHKHRHEKSRNKHKRYFDSDVTDNFYIFNVHQNEYLYAADNSHAYDSNRRRVFTWRRCKNKKVTQGVWKFKKIYKNSYFIINNFHNEYLYAENVNYAYDTKRRKIFTWRNTNRMWWEGFEGKWELENIYGYDCKFNILNTFYNEYLYAASSLHGYNWERRRVFTWQFKNQKVTEGVWEIENENAKYNLQRDFPDYDKENINLGIINDNNDNDIINALEPVWNLL